MYTVMDSIERRPATPKIYQGSSERILKPSRCLSVMLTAMPARSNSVYTTSVGIKPQPDGFGCRVANDRDASPKAVQLETREKMVRPPGKNACFEKYSLEVELSRSTK